MRGKGALYHTTSLSLIALSAYSSTPITRIPNPNLHSTPSSSHSMPNRTKILKHTICSSARIRRPNGSAVCHCRYYSTPNIPSMTPVPALQKRHSTRHSHHKKSQSRHQNNQTNEQSIPYDESLEFNAEGTAPMNPSNNPLIAQPHDPFVKDYEFLDAILNKNPKRILTHYRLQYLSGAEPLHLISFRKKVLNRILEACLVQRNFKYGKAFFERYFLLDRSIEDTSQYQATDETKQAFFDSERNLLGWGRWKCGECGEENQSREIRCGGCNVMRDELLLGKDHVLQQKLKDPSLEHLKQSVEEIESQISEEEYFPDLPPVKPNYDTFHHYANLCARAGDTDELLRLLDLMGQHGWNPSLGIYVALLRLHVENGNYDAFYECYNQFFSRSGIAPDLAALRLLSRVLRAERNVEDFETLFQQMVVASVSQQNADSSVALQNELHIPLSRLDLKYRNVGVDIVVFNDLLGMYQVLGNAKRIVELIDTYVIKSYSADPEGVQLEPTANTFNYALLALADIGDGAEFDRIYKEMQAWGQRKEQLQPNTLTYNAHIKLYMGIGATKHIKSLVMPHLRLSPEDKSESKVTPTAETWQLLMEAFYAEVKTMMELIAWMREFPSLLAADRYGVIFNATLKHLESKYGAKATHNDLIVQDVLVNAFRAYNLSAVPLHESTLRVMCRLLSLAADRQLVAPGGAKYWSHVMYRACTRSYAEGTLPSEETIQALVQLAQMPEQEANTWREALANGNTGFESFCEAVMDGYLGRYEKFYFANKDAEDAKESATEKQPPMQQV